MTEDIGLTFEDFEIKEDVSVESTENTNEITEGQTKEAAAESEAEAKAEAAPTEGEAEAGDNSGAESPTQEYTPNFKYSVKGEEKEFPEWIREVVKSKETEQQLVDMFTKLDGFDGIKESRSAIEQELNSYKQSIENDVYPALDKIAEFDKALNTGDFSKSWELTGVKPTELMDYMLMDENLSQQLYQKVLAQVEAEPNAIAQQRATYQEQQRSRELELQNQNLTNRLQSLEQNTYNQALDFAMAQNMDKANAYDSLQGAGAFKNFVDMVAESKRARGEQVAPGALIDEAVNMLGLGGVATTQQGNIVNTNEQPKVEPQAQKQPQALPNLGTGSNVSMVQKVATSWDDWETGLQKS